MTTDRFQVVIIGGGIAGLTAAAHLAAKGIEPLVLEADNEWAGGRLAGGHPDIFEYDGKTWEFPSEHGMHALWGGYVNMRATIERFTDMELIESLNEEWINRWGQQVARVDAGYAVRNSWIPAPLHYLQLLLWRRFWGTINLLDFLSLPGFLNSIFLTLAFDPIREQIRLDGLKMKDYFMLWTPNLQATFTGIGINMLASNKEDINLTAFVAAIRFYTMMRRDSWTLEYMPQNPREAFILPLVEHIENDGGKVLFGARAREISPSDTGWRLKFESAKLGGHQTLETEHIIFATNPAGAKKILDKSPDLHSDHIRFPEETQSTTVRFWFDKAPDTITQGGMFTGDFVMDNYFWLHLIQDEFREWTKETDGSVLEVHIYNRTLLDQTEPFIVNVVTQNVLLAFPEMEGHIVHTAYRSNGFHQTQFMIPKEEDSIFVDTPWQNIYASGDWVGYDTPTFWMERSTTTGIAAANRVLENYDIEPYDILDVPPPEMTVRIIETIMRGLRLIFAPIFVFLFRLFRRE